MSLFQNTEVTSQYEFIGVHQKVSNPTNFMFLPRRPAFQILEHPNPTNQLNEYTTFLLIPEKKYLYFKKQIKDKNVY